MRRLIGNFLEAAGVVVYPPSCINCGRALTTRPEIGLCAACAEVLEPNDGPRCQRCDQPISHYDKTMFCQTCSVNPPEFLCLKAPWIYGGGISALVTAAKFGRREDLAYALGRLLAQDFKVSELLKSVAVCVPVPLGTRRRAQRGYNQSAIIAKVLAKTWGVKVLHALKRIRETRPQTDLALLGRKTNMVEAFNCPKRVLGRVALIDDVVTSGETVRAASAALIKGGAQEVVVVAVARAELVQ